jgi:adenylate cyclase|tara:strand:+ start:1842 stop:3878 length:2037 start_codon:yes stop_codon:yes gene_type:complete
MIKKIKSFFLNKSLVIFALLFFVILLIRLANLDYVQSITNLSLDSYQKIFKYELAETPVIIVDVDEKSLGKIGQFPWNRKIFGDLVKTLKESGASVISFDIFFSEEDKQNPNQILKAYNLNRESSLASEILKLPNNDDYFLNQIKNSNVVMPILGLVQKPINLQNQKSKAKFINRGEDPRKYTYSFAHGLTSLKKINDQTSGIGNISVVNDTDAVLRKAPLLVSIQNELFPSLSIETLRLFKKQKNILVQSDTVGINSIKLRPYTIKTDANAMFWIKYKKPKKNQYISAFDVLEKKFEKNIFKNKIVLIGSSAQGIFDFAKISTGDTIPGVEVHANIIENIFNNQILKRSSSSILVEVFILILGTIFAFFFADNAKPKSSILFYLLLIFIILAFGFGSYKQNYLIDISYPIFAITIMFLSGLYLRYLRENEIAISFEKKQIILKQEREIAGEVQKKLFPKLDEKEERIYGANIPARDVSGDYFDVIKINKDEFYFTLADVSGKGIKAGILMASASAVFKSLAKTNVPISNISLRMNNQVSESSYQGMFITAVIGRINLKTGDMEYINHGHEPVMVANQEKNFKYLESSFPPLGIMPIDDESFFESTKENFKGENIFIYTDGVTEGYLSNGLELGVKGFEEIINKSNDINPKEVITSIVDLLKSDYLRDDITCLGIQFK